MGNMLRDEWQKIKQHRIAIKITTLILLIAILLIVMGYHIDGIGFNGGTSVTIATTTGSTASITRTVNPQPGKTLWDWLQLLIIPVVLAIGGFWLNQIQSSREERTMARRAQVDREIALDNQREAKLQDYLDKMSDLVFSHDLLQSKEGDPSRLIARARTLSVVRELDTVRKGSLIRFLHESLLILTEHISSDSSITFYNRSELKVPSGIISLNEADLSGADLSGAILMGANLEGANLSEANLSGAYLYEVNLENANLSSINLSGAELGVFLLSTEASNLSSANLTGANLNKANLEKVNLSQTILSRADLREANLAYAYLGGATGITNEELEKVAKSLKGATMPDNSTSLVLPFSLALYLFNQ
jgi:Pentapeptide repeats (8 copies)